MTGRPCPQCGGPLRRARAVWCGQTCRDAAGRVRRASMLADVLHLLRYGLRLDDVARRVGSTPDAVDRAVRRTDPGRTDPDLSDLDLQALRRLVRADLARSRSEADAAMSDRARGWRWTS